jgi:threonine aldolase
MMARAEVGDDVYGDDPTVNALQEYAAGLMGKEAALFACSGTMGNLLGILAQTRRGDGVILGAQSHIYNYEAGGVAALAGVLPYLLDDRSGLPLAGSIRETYRGAENVHFAPARLFCLENTHNRAGGEATTPEEWAPLIREARELGLPIHLDGARLFNASVACGVEPKRYAEQADTVQICLSKGLGAPMGSLLLGPSAVIDEARRWRKRIGGGLRQAGIVAAAGRYALEHQAARLGEDHALAAVLADGLAARGFQVAPCRRRTNMVYFRLGPNQPDAAALVSACEARGLLLGAAADRQIRMVCHLDVNAADVAQALEILSEEAPVR